MEAVVASVEAWPLFPPEAREDLELLVGHRPALAKGCAQRLELLGHPAHADAQDETPARDVVDGRGDLRGVQRGAVGQHHHAHAERDRLGAAGEKGEAREGLEEGTIRRDDEALIGAVRVGRVDAPRRDDAIGGPDRIEAEDLRAPRRLGEDRGRGAARDREEDTELHARSLGARARTGRHRWRSRRSNRPPRVRVAPPAIRHMASLSKARPKRAFTSSTSGAAGLMAAMSPPATRRSPRSGAARAGRRGRGPRRTGRCPARTRPRGSRRSGGGRLR